MTGTDRVALSGPNIIGNLYCRDFRWPADLRAELYCWLYATFRPAPSAETPSETPETRRLTNL